MKKSLFKVLSPVFTLAVCLLTISAFGQRGTITSSVPTVDADVTITKTCELPKGKSVVIQTVSGKVSYIIYEKAKTDADEWVSTEKGELSEKDNKLAVICNKTAFTSKIEITASCDDCVAVRFRDCR